MHILVLTDRDWTHPQGGGTGTNLYGQVARWVAWGHRVTVVAGSYPGASAREELSPELTVHRMGSRLTVFPRAAWACLRHGVGRDADVVLEVINGITFLTPLWLRRPRVALVHHIHRDHYVTELGRPGAVAALLAETLPLRLLYRDTTFLTISDSGRRDLLEHGMPEDRVHVAYLGVEEPEFPAAAALDRAAPALPRAGSSSTSGSRCCSTSPRRSPTRTWTSPARATTAPCWRPRSPAAGSATA